MIDSQYLVGIEALEAGVVDLSAIVFLLALVLSASIFLTAFESLRVGATFAIFGILLVAIFSPVMGVAGAHYELHTVQGELETVESYSQDGLAIALNVEGETRIYGFTNSESGGIGLMRGVSQGELMQIQQVDIYAPFVDTPPAKKLHSIQILNKEEK